MKNETWKSIPQFSCYQISSKGRVKSLKGKEERIISQKTKKNGYKEVCLINDLKKRKCLYVHRIVCSVFLGDLQNLNVNHIDGIKSNNCLDNLEVCTYSENMLHAYKLGLRKPNKLYRFNEDHIKRINLFRSQGFTQKQLSIIFNCNIKTIRNVLKNPLYGLK